MFVMKTNWPFNLNGRVYRLVMRVAHRYNWHYAPPIYPEGDTMLWCQWCGFRAVIKRAGDKDVINNEMGAEQRALAAERKGE